MQYFLYSLSITFLFINYKIIISDLKNKIIPNKYLLYLLFLIPFYYIYIIFYFPEINYLFFLLQMLLTFIISFILYSFGIWAAGDAKYLLVLSLFIPYIGIIPFIGNIALVTILYLLLYFIYFYLGKLVFNRKYRQGLLLNIKQDLNESWIVYKGNKGGNTYKIVTKFLLIFFIIFISIRLFRIYLFNSFLENGNSINYFLEILKKYNIYIMFLGIGIFIGGLYLFRFLINKFKKYISRKLNLDLKLIGNMLMLILFIILVSFISYELFNNYEKISKLLIKIFTLYLGLSLFIKIVIYSYKIAFGIAEYKYINIEKLKEGDIIDKTYLINIFGEQSALGYLNNPNSKQEIKIKKGRLLYPSPKKYFLQLKNKLSIKDLKKIKKCYKIVNEFNTNKKILLKENNTIKILNTFSFAPYILIGFFLTYLFSNKIFNLLLTFIIDLVKKIY